VQGKEVGGQIIFWIIIGLVFYVICFIALQQYVYRRIADKYNGIPIMSGWIDQEEDLGEEYEFQIAKITRFERLSEAEKSALRDFLKEERRRLETYNIEIQVSDKIVLDYKPKETKKLDMRKD
jgi:hypothetical protein